MPSPSADPVKEAIDAQSGRFEFFKQALTLGSAGIAGLAAILTDDAKIPQTVMRKLLVGGCGILFLATITAAVWGISVYANLLTRLQNENGVAPAAGARRTSATAKASMITHARGVFVTLFLAALALFCYAVVLLVFGSTTEKPKDATTLAMIAAAQKTATEAVAIADRNSAALATLGAEQQARFSAFEDVLRKSAEASQKRLDDLDRRLAAVELLLPTIKPIPRVALTREQAKKIQEALQARSFRPGPADGIFGRQTAAAIRAYQATRPDHPAITGSLSDDQARDLLQ